VILLSEDDPTEVLSLFDAGASGFLLKTGSLGELVEAIHVVIRGDVWISPKMLKHVLESLIDENRETFEAARRISSLTRREREVLARLSAGEDIEAIARDLMISLGTARTHIQNMLVKLGVHSRLEASAVTRRWGIDREFMVASDEAADSSRRRDGR
jgi:DNA-binding NarL/FixJ family response regulator